MYKSEKQEYKINKLCEVFPLIASLVFIMESNYLGLTYHDKNMREIFIQNGKNEMKMNCHFYN